MDEELNKKILKAIDESLPKQVGEMLRDRLDDLEQAEMDIERLQGVIDEKDSQIKKYRDLTELGAELEQKRVELFNRERDLDQRESEISEKERDQKVFEAETSQKCAEKQVEMLNGVLNTLCKNTNVRKSVMKQVPLRQYDENGNYLNYETHQETNDIVETEE